MKKLLASILALLLSGWCNLALAAVAIDATGSATETGQDNAITANINTTGTNRMVFAATHWAPTTDSVSGCTHAGSAMTESAAGPICNNVYCVNVFYRVAQTTGSQAVVCTMSGSNSNKSLTLVSFTDVDQSSPLGTPATYASTDDPMTVTPTIPANGAAVMFCTNNENGGTFAASDTEAVAHFPDTDGNFEALSQYRTTAGSTAMTFSNPTGNYSACIALPINVAVAPAGGDEFFMRRR